MYVSTEGAQETAQAGILKKSIILGAAAGTRAPLFFVLHLSVSIPFVSKLSHTASPISVSAYPNLEVATHVAID